MPSVLVSGDTFFLRTALSVADSANLVEYDDGHLPRRPLQGVVHLGQRAGLREHGPRFADLQLAPQLTCKGGCA